MAGIFEAMVDRTASFMPGRKLSIRSRAKQHAAQAAAIDEKHATKKENKPIVDGLMNFMSFATRTKQYKADAKSASTATATIVELSSLVQQAVAGEPALCDIDNNHQFIVLRPDKKKEVLLQLAAATKCHAFVLHNINLDDTHAAALAELVKRNTSLGLLSLERNNLKEDGLLKIAAAASGHPALRELRLGEQKKPISTAAVTRLIEAMEATPTLRKMGVGAVRDDLLLKRLDAATMHNRDLLRKQRVQAGGAEPPDPPWVALWEAKTNAAKLAIKAGGAKTAAPKRGERTAALDARAGIIAADLSAKAELLKPVDWADEARRLSCNEAPMFGKLAEGNDSSRDRASSASSTKNDDPAKSCNLTLTLTPTLALTLDLRRPRAAGSHGSSHLAARTLPPLAHRRSLARCSRTLLTCARHGRRLGGRSAHGGRHVAARDGGRAQGRHRRLRDQHVDRKRRLCVMRPHTRVYSSRSRVRATAALRVGVAVRVLTQHTTRDMT
jgi:hypothetical protein